MDNDPRFQFGNVVVVDTDCIGVIVKTWESLSHGKIHHEVYVRTYNCIREYDEKEINHFIYNKELNEQDLESYS